MRFKSISFLVALAAAGYFLGACAPAPSPAPSPAPPLLSAETALQRVPIEHYPQFEDHRNYQDLDRSIQKSLEYLQRLPPQRRLRFGPDQYSISELIESLQSFARLVATQPSPEVLNARIKAHYQVYCTSGQDPSGSVLYTGYYEPLLQGSRTRSTQFPIAVHPKPADLVEIDLGPFASDLAGRRIVGRFTGKTVVPYPSRGQIRKEAGFNTLAKPLVWLKDEIDLFILQIQGSGKVQMVDGEVLRIQFHGSNGRPYQSVGRMLIDTGCIPAPQMSMPAIRTYLQQHPDKIAAILDHNPRYIFFRQAKGEGPVGSLGVPLTPYRSLAVDHSLLPSAALAFVATPLPQVDNQGEVVQWVPYKGFALAQDAGSAIKGPARADFFMGSGLQAEVGAGRLKHTGTLYFLVRKP
jgi:membrane-bound lytic murein transglycosylase A